MLKICEREKAGKNKIYEKNPSDVLKYFLNMQVFACCQGGTQMQLYA